MSYADVIVACVGFYIHDSVMVIHFFFFQAEDGIRDLVRSRGLGDVYKRQPLEIYFRAFAVLRFLEVAIIKQNSFAVIQNDLAPVSYTHLTLPTIYSV